MSSIHYLDLEVGTFITCVNYMGFFGGGVTGGGCLFFSCTHGMQRSLGLGKNLSHSSDNATAVTRLNL